MFNPAFTPPGRSCVRMSDLPSSQTRCQLEHRLFSALQEPVFRRSAADGAPMLTMRLGEKEASIPLPSLKREFEIADDSADGQMLTRIAQSLDFVSLLRPGDPLPREVMTGEASWDPDPVHFELASTRLRLQLIDWFTAGTNADRTALDADSLLQIADDPHLKLQVQQAISGAADALGLRGANAVLDLLELLTRELAYIEALRDRLLRRVRALTEKIARVSRGFRGDANQVETITQVRRLSGIALRTIAVRFEELDAQTGEVMAALRNVEHQKAFIRGHRDWLYRSQRAWGPILEQWDDAGDELDSAMFALLSRTYQFLAPRFMPVTEWLSATTPGRTPAINKAPRMVW